MDSMKIQLLSDLHNEFLRGSSPVLSHGWSGSIPQTESDLIILAGDIDTGTKGIEWAISESDRLCKKIVYIPGNHEYYGHEYFDLAEKMSALCEGHDVYCLNPGVFIQDDLRIIGATLWTDYRVNVSFPQDLSMFYIERSLSDHRRITFNTGQLFRRFVPADALALHLEELSWIVQELNKPFEGKTVIVTHHGPHPVCQHPAFPVNELSAAFHSDLSSVIETNEIHLWAYGHTHSNLDEVVSDTRIVANQAGYPGENVNDFDASFIIEL